MSVKLLTEHHLEFLSLKGGCTGSSESSLVKMPHFLSFYFSETCVDEEDGALELTPSHPPSNIEDGKYT